MSQDAWNIVLLAGTLVAGGFAFLVYWFQLRGTRKVLTYDYQETKLKEFKDVSSDLVLTFKGQPVSDVSIINIIVRNSGRTPIVRTDFDEELVFVFEAKNILSASIVKVSPKELVATIDHNNLPQPNLHISRLLLNAGDEITLSVISTGFRSLDLYGRIVGIKTFNKRENTRTASYRGSLLLVVTSFTAAFISLMMTFYSAFHAFQLLPAWNSALLLFIMIFLISGAAVGGFLVLRKD
jgi:hypothetical protein